jgi:hypothetical protein
MPADCAHAGPEDLTMTARDVMRITGFSENFTYSALLDGRIPGRIECGRRVLVNRAAFEGWLAGRSTDAPTAPEAPTITNLPDND